MSKEKNSKFLSWFYELASNDRPRRLSANRDIILHVIAAETEATGDLARTRENGMAVDTNYTLKRLIRGLSSSRECARQGFATCLSDLMGIPAVPLDLALTLIEESTKVIFILIIIMKTILMRTKQVYAASLKSSL